MKKLIIILILISTQSCSSGLKNADQRMPDNYPYTVYILNQGWHTGIIIKVSDVNENDFPEIKKFKNNEYLDIGWGDEEYYRIPGIDLKLAFRALFSPTSSALKIKTFNIPVDMYYKTFKYCIACYLTENEFNELCRYISNSFYKPNGKPVMLENRSDIVYFYKAMGDYHLFNTCNTWVADALHFSGIPLESSFVISSSDLFAAVKDYGKVLVNKY
jgi:uncharacterized protein (TIGR02117 family)